MRFRLVYEELPIYLLAFLVITGEVFSLERNPVQQHSISKEATEKIWLGSLRSTVQQWTDVTCSMTGAGKISE